MSNHHDKVTREQFPLYSHKLELISLPMFALIAQLSRLLCGLPAMSHSCIFCFLPDDLVAPIFFPAPFWAKDREPLFPWSLNAVGLLCWDNRLTLLFGRPSFDCFWHFGAG